MLTIGEKIFCVGSKETHLLVHALSQQPRTVILFTHRHSLTGLCQVLPPYLRVVAQAHCGLSDLQGLPDSLMQKVTTLLGETSLGLCDVAVVENQWLSSLPPRPLR